MFLVILNPGMTDEVIIGEWKSYTKALDHADTIRSTGAEVDVARRYPDGTITFDF